MIGLEYILNLYGISQQELADKLGIKRQNINMWLKKRQNISKKYLPILSELFSIDESYFQKELDEIDKLIIQKEKLKQDLNPQIVGYDIEVKLGDDADLYEKPIFDKEEYNLIHQEIEKAKLVEEYRNIVSKIDNSFDISLLNQLNLILKDDLNDPIFIYTIEVLSHYYEVVPDWLGTEPDGALFAEGFYKFLDWYFENLNEQNK